MNVDLKQFHQVFIEESFEGLDSMENALMALDIHAVDSETINAIFRAAHSIKGGSATFGFSAIAGFTHVLETLLDQIRDGRRGVSATDVDLFLKAVDAMREMLRLLQQEQNCYTDSALSLKSIFEEILAADLRAAGHKINASPARKHGAMTIAPGTPLLIAAEPLHRGNFAGWHITFVPHRNIFRTGNCPLRILQELATLGSLTVEAQAQLPATLSGLDFEACYLSWQIHLVSECDSASIWELFDWVRDDSHIELTRVEAQPHHTPATLLNRNGVNKDEPNEGETRKSEVNVSDINTREAAYGSAVSALEVPQPLDSPLEAANTKPQISKKANPAEASSIRVGIDKIDSLINMVGELVITQSMLGQLSNELDPSRAPKLLEGLNQLAQNTRELQESVMRIRMLPISFTFSRFPRMVRDLGQQLGKIIHLELCGEHTELDKTVMEKIGDPLVHLVRNAVDHGIELPAERLAKGKPQQGKITLNAYHQSGNVIIEIIDDGKGLDRAQILAKALEKKLISAVEAQTFSDEQIYDLIFQPGFSTALTVSDVSGRGVGMDVVKRNIQALNGVVEIQSKAGQGSKILIRLPLTLAILDGQLVRENNHIYIFPLVSIVESMQYKIDNVRNIAGGCKVFKLREDYVPIVHLKDIFNIPALAFNDEQRLMVVVESDGEKVGVVVDELLAQQQVVIKSLEQNYRKVEGVSGATILGDGKVALILDVQGLVKIAGEQQLQDIAVIDASYKGGRSPGQALLQ